MFDVIEQRTKRSNWQKYKTGGLLEPRRVESYAKKLSPPWPKPIEATTALPSLLVHAETFNNTSLFNLMHTIVPLFLKKDATKQQVFNPQVRSFATFSDNSDATFGVR